MKEENKPLITIVTVCLNSEKYLEQTIKSVINQNYKNIEYIIIDGGSTDKTLDIIKKYEKHITKWVSESDNGIYDAMNKGINMASGELIGFLNSDDFYFPNALNQVSIKHEEEKADVLIGHLVLTNEKGEIIETVNCDVSKIKDNDFNFIHPSTFVRTKLMKKYKFDTKYKIASDYKFLLDLFLKNYKFVNIDHNITNFREGGASSFWLKKTIERVKINKKQLRLSKVYTIKLIIRLFFKHLNKIFFTLLLGQKNYVKLKRNIKKLFLNKK